MAGTAEKRPGSVIGGVGEPVGLIYANPTFWPDCVKILFLMLTYMSTLRSKTGFFLVRPKNAYFANSPTAAIAFAFAPASIGKAARRLAFDGERIFLTCQLYASFCLDCVQAGANICGQMVEKD